MAAVVEGEAHLHDVWPENHVRSMVETTSSEDELLCSASTMEGKRLDAQCQNEKNTAKVSSR